MKLVFTLALSAMALFAQQASPALSAEQRELSQAIAQAGSSQVDLIRALELHLRKYPSSAQRADVEQAIVKTALETDDKRRILEYGERVLARDATNPDLLERLARLLLNNDNDKDANTRALSHAKALEKWAQDQGKLEGGIHNAAQRYEELHMAAAKALVYQARATGNLGKPEEAIALAQSSFDASPSAESAREIARWLERTGKLKEAIAPLADAFLLDSPQSRARADVRNKLAEVAAKVNAGEAEIGLELLRAHERIEKHVADRRATLVGLEPNFEAAEPLDYVVSGVDGKKLQLKSLLGKVIVMDFWATWCVPCRAQQPLYDQVKAKYKDNPNVIFLNIASDEDKSVVKPFLDENKWDKTIYYDDGLAIFLKVASIPTTVIFSPRGEISSRMVGFIPELFVGMLIERIEESLKER
jgi:thiol-disulfide isomerase/thioredoxin